MYEEIRNQNKWKIEDNRERDLIQKIHINLVINTEARCCGILISQSFCFATLKNVYFQKQYAVYNDKC